MRKIINSTYITLDGVIENPQDWPSLGSFDEAGNAIQTQLLLKCGAVLMGRRTYEAFAPAWSARSGDSYSDRINSMSKFVVSNSLTDPAWSNTEVIGGDVIAAIERLKELPGHDIIQYGFGQLSFALMAAGMLDELRLWIHPFFIGRGGPSDLIYRDAAMTKFDFVEANTLPSGVVILSYSFRANEPLS